MRTGACETKGGGASGNGWVSESASPATAPCGTGRSSSANQGSPVVRSKVNRRPILVAWISAGILAPSRSSSTSTGWAETS